MDHIFGDSDDISFGSSQSDSAIPQNTRIRNNNNQRIQTPPVRPNRTHTERNFSKTNSNQFRPRTQRTQGNQDLTIIDNTPSLSRLIA